MQKVKRILSLSSYVYIMDGIINNLHFMVFSETGTLVLMHKYVIKQGNNNLPLCLSKFYWLLIVVQKCVDAPIQVPWAHLGFCWLLILLNLVELHSFFTFFLTRKIVSSTFEICTSSTGVEVGLIIEHFEQQHKLWQLMFLAGRLVHQGHFLALPSL